MSPICRICLAVSFALAALSASAAQGAGKPNVLFILTEDQGAHLSLLGTPGLQTPSMDALGRAGVFFPRAYVAYPVCSPSKACLYTSLHSHTNGILNNTPNYHKPAARLTEAEKNNALYRSNRLPPGTPTLVERLKAAGYYQGVTHKLHVAPVESFPYDEFIPGANGKAVAGFLARAAKTGKPWHLFYNVSVSHRPFPDSDKIKIRVNPASVKLPRFLPDTPLVRQDWAEYLAAVEAADLLVGEGISALRSSGQDQNTIIVCLAGDHGPAFPHGKMTLHNLGLHVTLSISGPGLQRGVVSDALASELDLAPTLLDLLGLERLPRSHGLSLRPVLEGRPGARGHDFVFSEISDRGVLPNPGMQERSVCDGRWHLIHRQKVTPAWRQVQADSKDMRPWGNRSYAEILRVKDHFPEPYRVLAEMDPQNLGGQPPAIEFYDLQTDPDEMHNLAKDSNSEIQQQRLWEALRAWSVATVDAFAPLSATP